MSDNYVLDILGGLQQSKSKKQINSDIKQLEKAINILRLTATFAKADTKKELNAYIAQLSNQLSTIKLKAKIDNKSLKSEVNKALNNVSFKDIDSLNIDGNKTKLKLQKVISDAKVFVEKNPISVGINIESKKNKLDNDLTTYLNKYTKITESSVLLEESNKVRDLIDAITDKKSLTEATDAFRLFKSEVSATGFASKSTADKVKSMLGHITKIGSAFGLASIAVNNFVKSIKTLQSNNTILTEISKTSEMTKSQLKELGDEAFKVASKFGQLSSNYLLAVQEMARSGYEETSKELGELSLLAQSAGDMTAENANNYLLATDAAYKYSGSVEKLNAALDGANYISNRNSASLTDIADATRVSASFAANAGVAIDELTAAEATMIATTKRSGSEIGRAFRSIVLNLQQVSGEFDGEVIDEEQLKKVEERCHSLGVELEYMKDGIATLRNPIEVLKDLAEVYNSLPDNSAEKQGLISDLGGKYHANALSALLSRWDMYEKMLGEFSQGAGSALEEAEKTANSWEGRLNSLQNSWDSFINTLTNKEAVMGSISFFDRLIQGAEELTDAIGEIPVVLTTLNTAMVAMKKDYGITQLVNPETKKLDIQGNIFGIDFSAIKEQKKHFEEAKGAINLWNDAILNGENDIESFGNSLVKNNAQFKAYLQTTSKDAPASLAGYKSYLNAAGISTDALRIKTILLNSAISMGIGFAIQLAVQGITYLIQREEELRQATEEAIEAFESISSEVESLEDKLSDLNNQINQLDPITDAEDIENLQLETEELEKQLAILKEKQRIAGAEADKAAQKSLGMTEASRYKTEERESAYGGVETGAAYVTKDEELLNAIEAYDEYKAKVDEANDSLANMAETGEYTEKEWEEQEQIVSTYSDKMDDARAHANELAVSLDEQKQGLDGNTDASQTLLTKIDNVITKYDQWLNRINGTTEALEEQEEAEKEVTNESTDTFGAQLIASQEALDKFKSSVQSAKDAYTTLLSGNYSSSDLLDSIQTINQAVSDMGGSLNWEFINSQTDSLELLGDAIQHISQKYAESILSGAGIDIDSEFGQMLADMIIQAFEAEVAFESMNSQLDNLQSSYQTLTGILESYNETGYITLDNLQSLLTADENLIAMLEVENGQLVLNQAAYENLVAVQLLEFKAKLNDAAAAEIETLAKQKAEQATNQNADASQNAVAKLDAETQAFNRNTSAAIANAVAKAEESGVSEEEIQGVFDKYTEVWNSAMSNYNVDFDGFMSGGKSAASKVGGEHADAYIKAFEEEYNNLKDMLNRGEISEAQYLNRLRALYNKYFRDRKKYLDEFKKYESEYLSGMLDLHNKALSGISTLLNRKISAANDAKDAAISALEEEKEKAEEAYQAQIDAIEKEKDAIDDLIKEKNKKIDSINEEIDAIERAAETRKKNIQLEKDQYNLEKMLNNRSSLVYKDGQFVWDTDTRGIRDAREKVREDQEALHIDGLKNEISLIQKEIDLLEEKKDSLSEEQDHIQKLMDESNKYYDNLIKQQEKMWDSVIRGMEQNKSRWEELAEVEEIAKAFSYIQQVFGDLGYTVEDVLNGSDAAFEDFKSRYISLISDVNSNSDFTEGLVYATGVAKENLGSFLDKTKETAEGLDELGEKGSEMDSVADGIDKISDSATSASTSTEGLSDNLSTINDTLTAIPEADKFDILTASFTNLGDAIKGVATALGVGEEGTVGGLVGALKELSELSLGEEETGIVSQFNNLKTAVEGVASAISGGGSSGGGKGGDASGSSSASMSAGAGGESTSGLVGAIEEFKSATDEALGGGGESGAGEGSGSGGTGAIPQFKELKTAVDDVTTAIGSGDAEGGESSGEGESDTLIGSIVNLGDTTQEEMGEQDGDGIIGKFNEFKGVIEEAANQVKSISEGLDEIDGKEVECSITVNVKMNGSIPAFASGTVLGNMQIESATYNAQYGKAFANGTIGLKHDEKNALRSEYGQPELTVYPNGTTELTTSPVMSDLPKGTVIYNEEETKKIMDNKSNPVGNAHADGTDDSIWTTLADGTKVRPLQPGDKMWDLYQKFNAYFKSIDGNLEKLVPNSLYEQNREWNKLADQISYANSVVNNNKNVQQPVNIQVGDINLTGVQDVNGLAHAIKTRLPNAMLQEMHRR